MPVRGGGHIMFADRAFETNVPQNELDKALVQSVWAWIDKARRRAFARGEIEVGRRYADVARMASNCGRDLQNPFRVMSRKQRAALIKWLPIDQRERFEHPGAPPMPEVLKNLPLKPPTRKRDPDEESDE